MYYRISTFRHSVSFPFTQEEKRHERLSTSHAVSEQHAGDTGRGQRGQDPGEQGRQRDLGDVACSTGSDLRQDTDLCSEGTNVSEALW